MYRIPDDLGLYLDTVVGEFFTQIRVGLYDFQFTLGDTNFAVQSEIKIFKDGKLAASWEPKTMPGESFLDLMNINVTRIEVPNDKTIILYFENGMEMHLFDNSDQYESMQIYRGEFTWII